MPHIPHLALSARDMDALRACRAGRCPPTLLSPASPQPARTSPIAHAPRCRPLLGFTHRPYPLGLAAALEHRLAPPPLLHRSHPATHDGRSSPSRASPWPPPLHTCTAPQTCAPFPSPHFMLSLPWPPGLYRSHSPTATYKSPTLPSSPLELTDVRRAPASKCRPQLPPSPPPFPSLSAAIQVSPRL